MYYWCQYTIGLPYCILHDLLSIYLWGYIKYYCIGFIISLYISSPIIILLNFLGIHQSTYTLYYNTLFVGLCFAWLFQYWAANDIHKPKIINKIINYTTINESYIILKWLPKHKPLTWATGEDLTYKIYIVALLLVTLQKINKPNPEINILVDVIKNSLLVYFAISAIMKWKREEKNRKRTKRKSVIKRINRERE